MKIAIVGRAPSAALAPWHADDWSVWAMAWCAAGPAARYFDIHARFHRARYGGPGYEAFLSTLSPLVMLYDPHPHALPYPLAAVRQLVGDGVLTSSAAFMMANAILERPAEIGLWGIDMAMASEYREQRPAMHFLMGMARGIGIKVTLPPGCPLLPCGPDYGD